MEIGVHKVAMTAPSDVSELDRLIEAGTDPAIFVSGDAEHQCAPGAAPIAAVVRV